MSEYTMSKQIEVELINEKLFSANKMEFILWKNLFLRLSCAHKN